MEHFNKKLSDFYNSSEPLGSDLPEELSWQNMEDGIREKMDEKPSGGLSSWRKYLPLVLVLGAVSLSFIVFNQFNSKYTNANYNKLEPTQLAQYSHTSIERKSKGSQIEESSFVLSTLAESKEKPTIESKKVVIRKTFKGDMVDKVTEKKARTVSSTKNTIPIKEEQKSKKNSEAVQKRAKTERKTSIVSKSTRVPIVAQYNSPQLASNVESQFKPSHKYEDSEKQIKVSEENFYDTVHSPTRGLNESQVESPTLAISLPKSKKESSRNENLSIQVPTTIMSLKARALKITRTELKIYPKDSGVSPAPPPKDPRLSERGSSISLSSGLAYLIPSYRNNKDISGSSERGIASYLVQGDFTYNLGKRYFLRTGLLHEKLVYEFDWEGTVEEDYFVPNALVQIRHSVVSGQEHHIHADTTVTAPSIRTVLDYNEFSQLSLPIALGYRLALRKLNLDFGLGPELTVYSYSKGKTYREDIIEYDGADNEIYPSKLKFAVLAQSRLSYGLSNNWSLFGQLAYKKHLTNWTADQDVIFVPQVINGSAGITYHFRRK